MDLLIYIIGSYILAIPISILIAIYGSNEINNDPLNDTTSIGNATVFFICAPMSIPISILLYIVYSVFQFFCLFSGKKD